jgi:hypothetical protein
LEQEYRTDILAETVFPETKPGFQVRICFWPMKFAIKMGVVPGFFISGDQGEKFGVSPQLPIQRTEKLPDFQLL